MNNELKEWTEYQKLPLVLKRKNLSNKLISLSSKKENVYNKYILFIIAYNLPGNEKDIDLLYKIVNKNYINGLCNKIFIKLSANILPSKAIELYLEEYREDEKHLKETIDKLNNFKQKEILKNDYLTL